MAWLRLLLLNLWVLVMLEWEMQRKMGKAMARWRLEWRKGR